MSNRKLPPPPLVTRPEENNNRTDTSGGRAPKARKPTSSRPVNTLDFKDSDIFKHSSKGTGFLRILGRKTKKGK